MASVEEFIDVSVPVARAYNQWTQVESFPEFMDGVTKVTRTSETGNHWVTRIGGVEREFDTEITEQHSDERVAWQSVDGTTHEGAVTFQRLDEVHTRVTVVLTWEPATFVEKAGSAVGVDARQVRSDLRRFKDFMEGQGPEEGLRRGDVDAPDHIQDGQGEDGASRSVSMGGGLDSPEPKDADSATPVGGTAGTASGNGSKGRDTDPSRDSPVPDPVEMDPAVDDPDSGGAREYGG